MPLSPAVKVPAILVLDMTANVTVEPLRVLDSRFELLTVIETEPFVVPLAAVYAVSVPRSTNITFAALACELASLLAPVVELAVAWLFALLLAGVAGCDGFAANATVGRAARADEAENANVWVWTEV